MKNEDDVPLWVTNTPAARAKELMEQRVIRELCLTLPPDQAEAILVGYMNGDKQCQELFERTAERLPKTRHQRPNTWQRAGHGTQRQRRAARNLLRP